MWIASFVPVGASNAPIATPIVSLWIGSQKSVAPQVEQKPRCTFSDERYHATLNSPSTLSAVRGTSVDAQ
jgi:hypothetical protein